MTANRRRSTSFTDSDLLRRVRAGEAEALAELYDRYAPRLYGLARLLAREPAAAEAAVRDAFLQVWRAPTHGEGLPWLAALVRRRCLAYTRQQLEAPSPAMAAALTVDLAAVRESAVRRAVAALPDDQREALRLAFINGLTRQEIAAHLAVAEADLHARVRLGLGRLLAVAQED